MHRTWVVGIAAASAASLYAGNLRTHADQHPASATAISPASSATLDRRNAQLRLVQVVFRHGARTPLTNESLLWKGHVWDVCGCAYEAMPMKLTDIQGGPPPPAPEDEKQRSIKLPGGCHKGELTILGQKQALELGVWLRLNYIDTHGFLPASYQEGALHARTTNFSRTRATLAGVLRGLYPDDQGPVPVVTSGELDEILYSDSRACPHLSLLMKAAAAMMKAKADQRAAELADLKGQLSQMLQLPEGFWGRKWQFTDIHDALTSLNAHGKSLPPSLTPEMRHTVNLLATQEFGAVISPSVEDEHGKTLLRLSMGRLLDQLLANMDKAAAATAGTSTSSSNSNNSSSIKDGVKMVLYSGHDSTIMPLLSALGVEVTTWPPYLSNLVFELWELQPPAAPPPTKMPKHAPGQTSGSSSNNSSSGGGGSGPAGGGAGPFVVRVLYNKEPVELQDEVPKSGHAVELGVFKAQVLADFLLSQQDHEVACHVGMSHEGPLPTVVMSMSSPTAGTDDE